MWRTRGLAAAGVLVLAFVGWFLLGRDKGPAAPEGAPAAAQAPVQPATAPAPTIAIELLLLPDGEVKAIPGSVRIGLGVVSPDDAAAAPIGPDEPPEQAGATSYDALATVTRWAAAPAQLLADGRVRVGPLRLPQADRYVLQARGEDRLRFYAASFAPDAVPATVTPIVGAGLRPQGVLEGARVLLRRVAPEQPAVWQRLQKWAAPELLEAFSEEPLPIVNRQVLAPFAPGPIEIVLEVNGVEAERRQVRLPAGRVTDVRFDATAQVVAHAVSMDLELEFVRQGSGTPIQGLQVQWLGDRMPQSRTTDARGRARFVGLDRQRDHQFNLLAPPPKDRLPEWPELRPLQIAPEELAETDTLRELVHHRVELAPLRWLIARLPPEAQQRRPGRHSPYPIHVLQRLRNGHWTDTAADHFIPTPEGPAVSIAEPGTYRVASALSPWQVLVSSPANVGDQVRQSVDFAGTPGTDVMMSVRRDGKALASAPVHIIGPLGNLPPAVLTADAGGRVVLPSATVPWVRVEVPGSDQIEVPLASSRALADFGLQRSE